MSNPDDRRAKLDINDIIRSGQLLIIDGGLSNVLEAQGCDLNHPLWTAHLLDHTPDDIVNAHLEYLKAGAQCITTSSYQASIPGLRAMGYDMQTAEQLILKSVELAEMAIEAALESRVINRKPLIAASIGPYGAYLADGSEYRGDYGVSNDTLKDFHLKKIQLLDSSKADLLACETIPSLQEAEVLAEILTQVDKPTWVSFCCKDERQINDGTAIDECVSLFDHHSKVFAVGVNCTHPKYISDLIRHIKSVEGAKRIVVYPNSGEVYHAKTKTWGGISEPALFVDMCEEWSKLGADIIGGCCRIGPTHIKRMSHLSH